MKTQGEDDQKVNKWGKKMKAMENTVNNKEKMKAEDREQE